MPDIQLRYGGTSFSFTYDEGRFDILGNPYEKPPLSDVELGERLDNPIHSRPLEEIVGPSDTVLFVVPDATRQVACGQVINLLIRRLIANGTAPFNIAIIFATGIHRPVTAEEKQTIHTPFLAQRNKTLTHNPHHRFQSVRWGEG